MAHLMQNRHLVFISDLGHTGPIWPQILDGVASSGWSVTILAPKLSIAQKKFFGLDYPSKNWKLVETSGFRSPYRQYAGYPKIIRNLFELPSKFKIIKKPKHQDLFDGYFEWKDKALRELKRIYMNDPFELIVSTSSPFITHVIANEFSTNSNVRWIADYRDMWSLNHASTSVDKLQLKYEMDILASATACSTTSEGFKQTLSQIFGGKIATIHNGFADLYPQKSFYKKKSITIVYPGQIYRNLQDIRPLLRAINIFNSLEFELSITLLISGYAISYVKEVLQEIVLQNVNWIKFGSVLPLKKSLKLQRNADFLLLLNCTNPKVHGWMQTKLYEYISSGVIIIAVGGTGSDESSKLISSTNTGFVLRSEGEIVDFFIRCTQDEFKQPIRNLKTIASLSRFQQGVDFGKFITNLK
jgi:hypothetical protein